MAENEEELKSLLMKVKEKSGKLWLKLNIQKTKIVTSGSITSRQIEGEKVETVTDFVFLGSKITVDGDCSHEIKRCLLLGRKVMTNVDIVLKNRRHFANKCPSSQSYIFWSYMDMTVESWRRLSTEELMLSNCGAGEDSWESLDCKDCKPVNPKGNQPWILIGRTDAEAETLILWPPDVKNWFIWKGPDAGKDWRWEEKGRTEDEMVGCTEFEQALGVGDGQRSLVCCSSWGLKESDTTQGLNWLTVWLSWFLGPQPNPELAPQNCVKNHNAVTCYGCLSGNLFGFSRTVNSTLLKMKYFSLCKNTL